MQIDRETRVRAKLALRQAMYYIYDPNVTLIDFGYPETQGKIVPGEVTMRFHVAKKLGGVALESAVEGGFTRPIPPTFAGFETDVPEGVYRLQQWGWGWGRPRRLRRDVRASRGDPLCGGISISDAHHNAYGTLGGIVVDRDTEEPMMLSNWHVLAADWRARPGLSIYQPGRRDGGGRSDTVATLARHAMAKNLDAAVARLTDERDIANDQVDLGPIRGVGRAELGMEVVKSGRTTKITRGQITAIDGLTKINYRGIDRVIHNVVTVEPFNVAEQVSAGGDSGSWWVNSETMEVVALHFAGSNRPERALAIEMPQVLNALNVDLFVS